MNAEQSVPGPDAESGPASEPVLDPEDAKIITLARSARARNRTPEGAAVRDATGRTYAAVSVALPSLKLSALEVAVAMAVSSGAERLEAAAIVSEADGLTASVVAAALDLKAGAVFLAAPDGSVVAVQRRAS